MADDPTNDDEVLSADELDRITGGGNPGGELGSPDPGPYAEPEPEGGMKNSQRLRKHPHR